MDFLVGAEPWGAEGVAHGYRGSSQARSVSFTRLVLVPGLGETEMRSDVAGIVWRPYSTSLHKGIGAPPNMFATSFHFSSHKHPVVASI